MPPRAPRTTATLERNGRAAPRAGGLLVVVVGEEGRGKEMLVSIARRRFGADASLAFPSRVTTRPTAVDDAAVTRREFRDMANAGAFLAIWETGGHSYGLGADARHSLDGGRTVVVVAGREAADALRQVWNDVRVVEVKAGPDTAVAARGAGHRPDIAVHHHGDVAAAVRRFHEVIMRLRLERLTTPAVDAPGSARLRLLASAGKRPSRVVRRPLQTDGNRA